jgi:hypothetical protein
MRTVWLPVCPLVTVKLTGLFVAAREVFGDAVVEGVAAVLGDTRDGFTGPQIAGLLQSAQVPDPGNITKRHRISQALLQKIQAWLSIRRQGVRRS